MKQTIYLLLLVLTACASSDFKNHKQNYSMMNEIKNGKDIIIKGETIEETLDLISMLEPIPVNELASFVTVHSNIYFQDCTFSGEILASLKSKGVVATQFMGSVAFINCRFSEKLDFRSAVFHGPVDFSKSTFVKGGNFQDAIFMQRSTFNESFWKGEGKFQQARFYHSTSFIETWAKDHMMFQKAVFRDEANFSVSDYSKYVDFSLARFNNKSTFNYVKWHDRAVFTNCVWHDDVTFLNGIFGSITFKGSRSEGVFTIEGENISDTYIPMD